MKGWKMALALGAAAAAAGAVAGEYFYRFALTQQIDKTAAFNAPHNRPTGAPRGTLAADREWLNAQPHEDWWLTSGDGLQLHALCVRAGGNAPWAVLCHGYTGQASGMAEYARRFYDAGFSLLLPDARGHGQSEGGYIGMGWPERRDIAAWVQRVTAENGAPDIVLMGVSMGAATVMMTAGEPLPPNVRAIVEDCGYTTAWEEFRYQLKKTYGLPPFPVLYTADALLRRRAGFSLRRPALRHRWRTPARRCCSSTAGRMPSFPLPCWMRCMRRRGVPRKNMWSRMQAMRSPCAWRPRAIGQRCSDSSAAGCRCPARSGQWLRIRRKSRYKASHT